MKASIRDYINDLAETIYKVLKLDPNFEIEKVVEQLGGTIVNDRSLQSYIDNFDAKIEKNRHYPDSEFVITVSNFKHENRKRFSIAHELGHLFLHMDFLNKQKWYKLEFADSTYYRYGHGTEEKEADEFAAAFLMPKSVFIDVSQQNLENGYYLVEKIAEDFGVSQIAASIRGYNLGLWER